MSSWDKRDPKAQRKAADALLRRQLRDAVGPFSPFWRERFTALRLTANSIATVAQLSKVPAVGERDICPDGDPRGAARLVLQADEAGFAMHAGGPDLRKALVKRAIGSSSYRRQVEAQIRPTTYHYAGQALTFPVASTRSDLDLVARAGNRAWQVLGLSSRDVLVSAVPVAPRLHHEALRLAALAAGAPALFPGDDLLALVETLRVVPATVLAAEPSTAADLLADLAETGAHLDTVTTLLLLGAPTADERAAVGEALSASGSEQVRVLALHGPAEGRVLWAECAPGSGLHTYPDLDIVEIVDPDTGDKAASAAGGELVITQLGFRGTALLRWRTGEVAPDPIAVDACKGCGRTVPRVSSSLRTGAFVAPLETPAGEFMADMRAVAGALSGRADLTDWRVEVRKAQRSSLDELLVFIDPSGDETEAAVGVYRDVRAAAGMAPTQVVVVQSDQLPALGGTGRLEEAVSTRISVRR
ncbi:MAG TPA: hypothetical protein VNB94_07885 [Mycobacteriales bacterium]|nr:hypothetical protein [Mycobacteriales bacterium]